MELKKNPKKDLNRNSGMYFVVGLFSVLMLTYVALEWKTFFETPDYSISMNVDEELIEEIELFEIETPPPPKKITTPPIIEVIPDEEETIETVIEVIEPEPDTVIETLEDIDFEKVVEEPKVDWINIEEVPVFPGCENDQDKRACFQKMMNKHISKAFKYPEMAQEMGIQGKVFTQFTIQKDGTISGIKLRGPHQILEKEAGRIIGKLPQMKPGKQRDKNVKVAFTIPINFRLN
ncbi:energy transducer TonB [Maribacter sp. 2307UL18-2]|uniref:energy transducer TonB n=1 Tax=Maribacter sp. 2307UL18-2 TaxID=3386274 RepID=UPI0039BC5887